LSINHELVIAGTKPSCRFYYYTLTLSIEVTTSHGYIPVFDTPYMSEWFNCALIVYYEYIFFNCLPKYLQKCDLIVNINNVVKLVDTVFFSVLVLSQFPTLTMHCKRPINFI